MRAIVVLLHEGGAQVDFGGEDECAGGISGPVVDIVERTSREVDLFITGHTHQNHTCEVDGRWVTSARSFDRLYTDIDVQLDRRTKQRNVSIDNVPVTRDVEAAVDLPAPIDKYDAPSAPLANRIIGAISADITRDQNDAGESALGDVIAETQLLATKAAGFGEAVVAFMNPSGIRASLDFDQSGTEGDGNVTYGEAFTVQPFGTAS